MMPMAVAKIVGVGPCQAIPARPAPAGFFVEKPQIMY